MNPVIQILNYPAVLFGWFFSIPWLGRFISFLWKGTIDIFWRLISLPDVILGLFGIFPQKKMRIAVISLVGENKEPLVKEDDLKDSIQNTIETYLEAANVRVILDKVERMEVPAPAVNLKVNCGGGAFRDDMGKVGMYFEQTIAKVCFNSAFQRFIGYAAPVIVFIVEDFHSSDIGCSMGPFTDYVTIEGRKPQCIAHEVAHACFLLHVKDNGNLAAHICGGRKLEWWQKAIVRSSRHVTYL